MPKCKIIEIQYALHHKLTPPLIRYYYTHTNTLLKKQTNNMLAYHLLLHNIIKIPNNIISK